MKINRIFIGFLLVVLYGCSNFTPTPATLDSSVSNQKAANYVTNSLSQFLTTKVIFNGIIESNYVLVEELHLEGKPKAVTVFSSDVANTDLADLFKKDQIASLLFASNSSFKRGDTTVTNVKYKDIDSLQGRNYLTSLGYNSNSHFLKRTTVFTKGFETVSEVDYVFPNKPSQD